MIGANSGIILADFTGDPLKKCLFCVNNPLYMKKQLSLLTFMFFACFFVFYSCSNKDVTPVPKTKTELLTQSSWKFNNAKANGSDASGYLQTCQRDNIYTFAASGSGTIDEGPSKCNGSDPQTTPFTWNFASNETIIHISVSLFNNTNNDFDLISLTDTELIVSTYYTPPIGPSVLVTITFQH